MENSNIHRLLKAGFWFIVLLSLFIVALTINAVKANKYIGSGEPASNVITVTGEGEVFAVPDIAEFTFTVMEEGDTVSDAQKKATEKSNAIIKYLDEQDIPERDIKTVSYNANPRYEFRRETIVCVRAPCIQPPGKQVLVGYQVSQTVRVKVRDTERAGDLLSGVGERGVSQVSGLSFTIDDEEALKRDAREQAIANAQEKAETLADDLNVDLVRVVSFFEDQGPRYYDDFAYARSESVALGGDGSLPSPELPVGENQIVSHVTITYEIR